MPGGRPVCLDVASFLFLTEDFFFWSAPAEVLSLALAMSGPRKILFGILLYLFNFFDQYFVGSDAVFMLFAVSLDAKIYSRRCMEEFDTGAGFILLLSAGSGATSKVFLAIFGKDA